MVEKKKEKHSVSRFFLFRYTILSSAFMLTVNLAGSRSLLAVVRRVVQDDKWPPAYSRVHLPLPPAHSLYVKINLSRTGDTICSIFIPTAHLDKTKPGPRSNLSFLLSNFQLNSTRAKTCTSIRTHSSAVVPRGADESNTDQRGSVTEKQSCVFFLNALNAKLVFGSVGCVCVCKLAFCPSPKAETDG